MKIIKVATALGTAFAILAGSLGSAGATGPDLTTAVSRYTLPESGWTTLHGRYVSNMESWFLGIRNLDGLVQVHQQAVTQAQPDPTPQMMPQAPMHAPQQQGAVTGTHMTGSSHGSMGPSNGYAGSMGGQHGPSRGSGSGMMGHGSGSRRH